MHTVLLTDPEQRAALACARALGRAGHRVLTIGASPGLAGVSRWVSRHIPIDPTRARDAEALRAAATAAVAAHGVQVVVPVSDFASGALLGCDNALRARVAGPSRESYERASDKDQLLLVAADCGLRVPRQHRLEAPGDPLPEPTLLGRSIVIKPARSEIWVDGRATKTGVRFADGAEELAEALARYPAEAYPLLLQERTVGAGIGVFLLRTAGATQLAFGHRRLREKPPAGGVSTYRESIHVPPELLSRCEALLDRLRYEGAAMLEFKEDAATGEHVIMEINARLCGSLQLAVDAWVNFPCALVAMTLGEPPVRDVTAVAGVRTVWELGELDHALAIARRSRAALHLPEGTATGWGAALSALFDHRWSDRAEVFRWSDPRPFLAELTRWVRRV